MSGSRSSRKSVADRAGGSGSSRKSVADRAGGLGSSRKSVADRAGGLGSSKQSVESRLGFSDECNPFGDRSLSEVFVWRKKFGDVDDAEERKLRRKLLAKRNASLEAVENVKRRREERAKAKEELDEFREELERHARLEALEDHSVKESEFFRKQAQLRTKERIRQGREKLVDVLARIPLLLEDHKLKREESDEDDDRIAVDSRDPMSMLRDSDVEQRKELLAEVERLLDSGGYSLEFWRAVKTVLLEMQEEKFRGSRSRFVAGEVETLLGSKSRLELLELEKEVRAKLDGRTGNSAVIDVDYWEEIRRSLEVYLARDLIREAHRKCLEIQGIYGGTEVKQEVLGTVGNTGSSQRKHWKPSDRPESPIPVSISSLGSRAEEFVLLDPDEDRRLLHEARLRVLRAKSALHNSLGNNSEASIQKEEAWIQKQSGQILDDDEEKFADTVDLPENSRNYWWFEKYKPRKPKFFNRVKTGFDWNKFNQAHYDKDNPPPKVVQGYKFHIFYPDLIDPSEAPSYSVEEDPSYPDGQFVVLRFKAGPPYEDIAFRIVNKEWEKSHRRGFFCRFEKGVLSLYFNFRRYRYRR